ncbi:MAG: CoA-transferase subunit beta [Salinirussus sp.]
MTDYTAREIMVTAAADELDNGESTLVGTGIPMLACNLAKATHAPDLQLVYESGVVDSELLTGGLPDIISGPKPASNAVSILPQFEGLSTYLQGGRIDVGFLGGAQVDKHGNLNSTVVGDYDDPTVRLPGSGGACEIACNAGRTLVITPHEPRRFPAEVDFVTSPGYVDGRDGRQELGLNGGPEAVITDKAVLRFDDAGEAYVDALHPGVSRAEVREATGWDLAFGTEVGRTDEPSAETVRLLREELDPTGQVINATE